MPQILNPIVETQKEIELNKEHMEKTIKRARLLRQRGQVSEGAAYLAGKLMKRAAWINATVMKLVQVVADLDKELRDYEVLPQDSEMLKQLGRGVIFAGGQRIDLKTIIAAMLGVSGPMGYAHGELRYPPGSVFNQTRSIEVEPDASIELPQTFRPSWVVVKYICVFKVTSEAPWEETITVTVPIQYLCADDEYCDDAKLQGVTFPQTLKALLDTGGLTPVLYGYWKSLEYTKILVPYDASKQEIQLPVIPTYSSVTSAALAATLAPWLSHNPVADSAVATVESVAMAKEAQVFGSFCLRPVLQINWTSALKLASAYVMGGFKDTLALLGPAIVEMFTTKGDSWSDVWKGEDTLNVDRKEEDEVKIDH